MPLEVRYGSFTHEGSPVVTIDKGRTFTQRGKQDIETVTINIAGFVTGTGDQQKTKIDEIVAAYDEENRNFRWRTSTGSARFILLNADTDDGIRVVGPPSFPQGTGAEWADGGRRSYNITLSANIKLSDAEEILEFSETVTFQQQVNRTFFAQPLDGVTVPFTLVTAANLPSIATQVGTAVGRDSYPTPPDPIWPIGATTFHQSPPEISRVSAESHKDEDTPQRFRVNWSFNIISLSTDLESIASEPNQFLTV